MSVGPRLAVLAVLAAGGTVFGGYYLWPSGRHIAACPPLHAKVPAAAKAALARYAGRIMFDRDRSKDGSLDMSWYDLLTGRSRQVSFDSHGRITDEFVEIPEGKFVRSVWVSYDGREWTTDREPVPLHPYSFGPEALSQANRDKVARGTATLVDHELVAGRETLHLHEIVHVPAVNPAKLNLPKGAHIPRRLFRARSFSIDTWVDPLTYLTVRTRANGSTSDEVWLPRTVANLAKMKVVIPNGFTRSFPRQGRGSGFSTLVSVSKSTRCAQS